MRGAPIITVLLPVRVAPVPSRRSTAAVNTQALDCPSSPTQSAAVAATPGQEHVATASIVQVAASALKGSQRPAGLAAVGESVTIF